LTDFLDLVFQAMVIADPLLHNGLLLRAKADVPDLATRFADRQYQDGMASAPRALGTTGFVPDQALQQRSAQKFSRGEVGREFVAPPFGVLMFHYIQRNISNSLCQAPKMSKLQRRDESRHASLVVVAAAAYAAAYAAATVRDSGGASGGNTTARGAAMRSAG
jgi:hypothetical protein